MIPPSPDFSIHPDCLLQIMLGRLLVVGWMSSISINHQLWAIDWWFTTAESPLTLKWKAAAAAAETWGRDTLKSWLAPHWVWQGSLWLHSLSISRNCFSYIHGALFLFQQDLLFRLPALCHREAALHNLISIHYCERCAHSAHFATTLTPTGSRGQYW